MDDIPYSDMNPASGEHKTVMTLYALLWLLLVFGLLPGTICFVLALLMFTLVPMTASHIRRKAAPGSLSANHMTWIIRTVAISAAVAVLMAFVGLAYLIAHVDFAPLLDCASAIMEKNDVLADAETQLLSSPCLDDFATANGHLLGAASLIAEGPFTLYVLWRLSKGVIRAHRDERVIDVKSWI
jgi:uncharacterized membrane protein